MISRRNLEFATATLTGVFGIAVAYSSLENGVSWTSAGVESGTFPFVTGLIIVAGSLVNLLRARTQQHEALLGTAELKRLGSLFLPAVAYVAAIPMLGIYAASPVYVFGTLIMQGAASALRAAILAVAATLALYLLFERMFQVSLPRGWLGAALGF